VKNLPRNIRRYTDIFTVCGAAFADVTSKLKQLKAARAKRHGRIYNTVEEFMEDRAMIIDLIMARGQTLKVSQ